MYVLWITLYSYPGGNVYKQFSEWSGTGFYGISFNQNCHK